MGEEFATGYIYIYINKQKGCEKTQERGKNNNNNNNEYYCCFLLLPIILLTFLFLFLFLSVLAFNKEVRKRLF